MLADGLDTVGAVNTIRKFVGTLVGILVGTLVGTLVGIICKMTKNLIYILQLQYL